MNSIALAIGLILSGPVAGADAPVFSAEEPAAEVRTGRLVDQALLFGTERGRALEQRLARLEQATTDQLVVVSLPTLGGRKIDEVAASLGNRWKIGRVGVGNGVVMLIAPTEGKVWISVGSGLAGLLTKQRAQGIVDRMLPALRSGDLPGGIERGVGEIEQVLQSDRRRPQRLSTPAGKAA